jgi:hypothetical protein
VASGTASRNSGRLWPRRLANAGVALAVIAVAGAAFVFSYSGVRAVALIGGVSVQLARYYPGLFDAVLVIACLAAVLLRDGRWWARLWAWVVIVVVLGAIGAADVLHAMNYALRHRPTEGIVAAAPAVAVLLAFSLLATVLRQSRTQRSPADVTEQPADVTEENEPFGGLIWDNSAATLPELPALPAPESSLASSSSSTPAIDSDDLDPWHVPESAESPLDD